LWAIKKRKSWELFVCGMRKQVVGARREEKVRVYVLGQRQGEERRRGEVG
jgi:hypothetical protein